MNYKIIRLAEFMSEINTNKLRSQINDVMADGMKLILMDLQDITFMNSSTIGALVATHKLVKEKGGTLSLCSLNEQVKTLFALTKMDHVFDIYVDRHEFMQKNAISAS